MANATMNHDLYGDANISDVSEHLSGLIHAATQHRYAGRNMIPISVAAALIQIILEGVWRRADEFARERKIANTN